MKTRKSDTDQYKRFIDTARELGCDEDEGAFDEKLKRIATAKTKPLTTSTKRPRKRRDPEKTG